MQEFNIKKARVLKFSNVNHFVTTWFTGEIFHDNHRKDCKNSNVFLRTKGWEMLVICQRLEVASNVHLIFVNECSYLGQLNWLHGLCYFLEPGETTSAGRSSNFNLHKLWLKTILLSPSTWIGIWLKGNNCCVCLSFKCCNSRISIGLQPRVTSSMKIYFFKFEVIFNISLKF